MCCEPAMEEDVKVEDLVTEYRQAGKVFGTAIADADARQLDEEAEDVEDLRVLQRVALVGDDDDEGDEALAQALSADEKAWLEQDAETVVGATLVEFMAKDLTEEDNDEGDDEWEAGDVSEGDESDGDRSDDDDDDAGEDG